MEYQTENVNILFSSIQFDFTDIVETPENYCIIVYYTVSLELQVTMLSDNCKYTYNIHFSFVPNHCYITIFVLFYCRTVGLKLFALDGGLHSRVSQNLSFLRNILFCFYQSVSIILFEYTYYYSIVMYSGAFVKNHRIYANF